MITVQDVRWLRAWFKDYVAEYMTGDADLRRNMRLKESHTMRVFREALAIARGLGLDAPAVRMIEAIVLLHDVGRFEQYRRHRTFSDAQSENHAKLTLAILRRRAVLERFTPHDRSIIRRAIAYHNLPQIPPGVRNPEVLLFSRLMRDADKLDILRLVISYYNAHPDKKNHAIAVGLHEAQDFTPEVLADLLEGRIVRSAHLRNQNDFKLLQMGWVYDVNFVPALKAMRRRKYLEKLRAALPDAPEADAAFARVSSVLAQRIREEG
jgi:putative nucleotidyltransferase with HDIG domain